MEEKKKRSKKGKLKEELEACKKEKEEYLNGWKRAKADFENYKKEEFRRMENFLSLERENLLLKIIPILDNFHRAEKEAKKEKGREEELVCGLLKIKKQIESLLKEEGVEEVRSLGEEFDPRYHEAVGTVEADPKKSGKVVEELQKGYLLNGKVIRPSKVKVVK